jgi:alpha-methylacyl-CoA racemase
LWSGKRGENYLDGGAPFYNVYETADGGYVSVAAIEPQFYARLLDRLGMEVDTFAQFDRSRWPAQRELFADVFRSRTRDDWVEHFRGADACFAPVLTADEAVAHEHNRQRRAFIEIDGVIQPAPAPRFRQSAAADPAEPPAPGRDTRTVLHEAGVAIDRIEDLIAAGVLGG